MGSLSRRSLFAGAVGSGAPAAAEIAVAPFSLTPERALLRKVDVLTMDDDFTEIRGVDVLLDGGKVAAIGENIVADGAREVDASGMILMPGMVDGHRHVWESIEAGQKVKTSKNYRGYHSWNNMRYGLCFRPEDMHFAQYAGALQAIDSGVTAVIDHAHITHGDEVEDAAARGLKESGISGYFCYQMRPTVKYGPGSTISAEQIAADAQKPADERHYRHAEQLCQRYFSDSSAPLQFGVGLSGAIGYMTMTQVAEEFRRVRALGAKLITHHVHKAAPSVQPPYLRGIADLYEAGLLGPDYHCSHANDLTPDELRMMRETGAKVCSTCMGEFPYNQAGRGPSVHGRARAAGVSAGIGLDVGIALTHDYFEHVRAAFWNLYKSETGARIASGYRSHDVLDFATRLGARSLGIGEMAGTVAVGKRADLVLLGTKRFGFANLGSLADRVVNFATLADIDSVWVAGALRKTQGQMIGVDWAALKRRKIEVQNYVFETAKTITIT